MIPTMLIILGLLTLLRPRLERQQRRYPDTTIPQQIITVGLCVLSTMLTRFLPFFIFRENQETPAFIRYIGKFLPSAVFGMLVIYCLKNVSFLSGNHGLPGAARDHSHHRSSSLKTPDAFLNLRRDDLLYAAAPFCILDTIG